MALYDWQESSLGEWEQWEREMAGDGLADHLILGLVGFLAMLTFVATVIVLVQGL